MGKPSAPQSPDPFATASAQTAANTAAIDQVAKLNAIDQNTPQGSVHYTRDANGVPTAENVTYNPQTQQYMDTTGAVRNSLANTAQGLIGSLPTGAFTGPSQGNQDAVTKAMYDKQLSLLQPQFDQARKQTATTLSERGIPIGSEIYNDEMNRQANTENQAETSAANNATLAGGQQYTQDLQNGLTLYNAPFNTLSAYLSGTPAPQQQNAVPSPTYSPIPNNITGDINQNYQNQVSQYNQQNSSLMNGLFGLGSAALGALPMLSDRRLKTNIKRIATLKNGLPLYSFRFKSGGPTMVGVMADEVERVLPSAVLLHPSGYKMVDYAKIGEAA